MSGYHIEWKNNSKTNGTIASEEKTAIETKNTVVAEEVNNNVEAAETTPVSNDVILNNSISDNVELTENNAITTPVNFIENRTAQSFAPKSENSIVKQSVIKKAERMLKKQDAKGVKTPSRGVLFVLAFFIPWLAVGLVTDWEMPVVWNLLWCLTCIGGIIHAFVVVNREA